MSTKPTFSQQELEIIERYLTHSMTAKERLQFQERLTTDPSLQVKVNEISLLIETVETSALKTKLDRFHETMEGTHSKTLHTPEIIERRNTTSKLPLYAIAACLLVIFGVFYFMTMPSPSEKLFAKHFVPDPGLPTTMSTQNNYPFFDAMVNYKRGEYDIAIGKWEQQLDDTTENDTLNFYLGVAYLAEGNGEKALSFLRKLETSRQSIFMEDAMYYRALAHIKKNEPDKAKRLLKENPSQRNNELLQDLKE
ncbi:tetratricopeptide repeat protein [Altibacter sp.]|uniref:tetratricopeptide repeat protein n=1 Tax=Altibacter sp. TaxID=2024823 RepID=UPI00258D896A|nr:tetratricopeptide repeat protein [Altibacter sp.]MCW9036716.1 tetratricopeptide repeat protein [Altibacter sp.]